MKRLTVKQITRKECEELILNVHYAKRWPSISFAFGLFDGDNLLGCVTYGYPPSSPLRNGIAGKEGNEFVLELNRLCLYENKHNYASFLISKSLKMLGNRIIVSFADTEQDHKGFVYQASNFTYHGLSAKRTDWKVKGKEHLHGMSIADEFRGVENRVQKMREKYGDDFYLKDRPRKHRYIYVTGSRKFVKEWRGKILYKQKEYPK